MKKKSIKTIILVFIIVSVIALAFYFFNYKKSKTEKSASTDTKTKTAVARETMYSTSIDVSGSVSAYDTQEVKIRATGTVTGVFVEEGDRVKKGQLLATIDDTDQQYEVANYKKQIQSAKINGISSDRDIELLEMRLKSAEKKLDNTRAYANFDGVVVSLSISEGDYFEAGDKVMTLIDDRKLIAKVEIDEIDIQMLKENDKVTITSDSSPGEIIEGHVSYIPMIGRYSSQGIGVMDVEITIDEPPKTLKPGFSFEGIIDVQSSQKMLLVPQSAVTTIRGTSTVTKLNDDGTTQVVTVQVKYLGENLYQITGGDVIDGDVLVCNVSSSNDVGLRSIMGGYGGMPPQGGMVPPNGRRF